MPHMNGFELSQKILELDVNVRVCFISAAEVNIEALRVSIRKKITELYLLYICIACLSIKQIQKTSSILLYYLTLGSLYSLLHN
jgi:hypothetical protein